MSIGWRRIALVILTLALAACAQRPPIADQSETRPPPPALAESQATIPDAREPSAESGATPAAPEAETAVRAALDQLGTPYRFGGNGPQGFDCSGLVRYSYRAAGLTLPRDTRQQRRLGQHLAAPAQWRPGDLLFYTRNRGRALHVVLFIGDGEFVHAPSSGGQVRIERVDAPHWKRRFVEARRVIDAGV